MINPVLAKTSFDEEIRLKKKRKTSSKGSATAANLRKLFSCFRTIPKIAPIVIKRTKEDNMSALIISFLSMI